MEGFRARKKARPQRAVDRVTAYAALGAWASTQVIGDIVNVVSPGYGVENRVGDEVALDSLTINAEFNFQWRVNIPGAILRFVVVYDLFPDLDSGGNNILPLWQDVFRGIAYDGTVIDSPMQQVNINNVERFVVLVDDRIDLNGTSGFYTTSTAICNRMDSREYEVNLRGLETHFVETGGVSGINRGAIYVGAFREFIDSSTWPGTNTPEIDVNLHTRVYFDEV